MKAGGLSVAQELLKGIDNVSPFSGSQYPYPLNQSLFGELDLDMLRHHAEDSDGSRLKEDLPFLLALAEGVEASQSDKDEIFINRCRGITVRQR
jgi:hypothetical protein